MKTERYTPARPDIPELRWINRLAYLMDSQFRLPGTRFRFGLDPLINLFPIAGDMAGFLVSAGLMLAMARKGASNKLVVLMSLNILLDATIGAIPVIGQIFDFFFKANNRNIRLMNEHYLENKHQGSGKGIIIWTLIILFLILALLIYLLWKVGAWLTGLIF
ncbi:DUF4112 domain-containing protein [Pedobacter deserti]|uniref:DUF4112 domain-containing protein n=1 Tax=Pedobacter deserti TaxID=2817382 RepID=UPI00210D84E6|nr:DUF4112 domain-containing protein [Pedobacter sp. SYSU D00382]